MKETLLKLLNSYVKPKNPKIKKFDVYVLTDDLWSGRIMCVVQVRSYHNLEKEERANIDRDITRIITALNLPEGSDYLISYSKLT